MKFDRSELIDWDKQPNPTLTGDDQNDNKCYSKQVSHFRQEQNYIDSCYKL